MSGRAAFAYVVVTTALGVLVFPRIPRVESWLDAFPPGVSLTLLLVGFAALLLAAWYFHDRPESVRQQMARRARAGLCPFCGYDLNGNASGLCPECGAIAPKNPATEKRRSDASGL